MKEEMISRKDFLKKTGLAALTGIFAINALREPISAATVTDNTTKTKNLTADNIKISPGISIHNSNKTNVEAVITAMAETVNAIYIEL